MTRPNLSEQELLRIEKKTELEALGINPYPAATFHTNTSAKDILENYSSNVNAYANVYIAGRVMSRRIMGAASFIEILDENTKIQVYNT